MPRQRFFFIQRRSAEPRCQRGVFAPASLLVLGLAAAPAGAGAQGRVVTVRMVDGGAYTMAFDPVRVTAAPGDTLRFVQSGRTPHNVEFRAVPAGVTLGALAKGPLLGQAGATYDIVLDARFAPGRYVYVCTPHEVVGMAGVLTVAPRRGPDSVPPAPQPRRPAEVVGAAKPGQAGTWSQA